ncbi:MAG TPA: exodeoxyribonuclease VII small subunit [Candidatus Paceibacterota bacterium]|nr:exodeoxyribonuclease VII small subunit [Candidatus Paceibacterota bacterium]
MKPKKESNDGITQSLEKLEAIVKWLDEQDQVDVHEGLTKVKEGAALVKELRARLKDVENEFKEVKGELEEDAREET